MSTEPKSGGVAKHLRANTFGAHPQLMPYILHKCNENPIIAELRACVEKEARCIMSGSPDEAQLLAWLANLTGAKTFLEVGVFRGCTTLALALAKPDLRIIGLDVDESFVNTARPFWAKAGVADRIDVRIAPAMESIKAMIEKKESVDFAFIDHAKIDYDNVYEALVSTDLMPRGGVIAVDNVLWGGSAAGPLDDADDDTKALARLNEKIRTDKRVSSVMVGIADGVTLVRKL